MKTGFTVSAIIGPVVTLSDERFHDVGEDMRLGGNSNDCGFANLSTESNKNAFLKE
jgi:hypothetical protein